MDIQNEILFNACKGISKSETFVKIEPISKGLSDDEKYYVETCDGKRLLLRLSGLSDYERKEAVFNMMKRVAATGVNMPTPVDMGKCNDGKNVYQLLTWCEGKDLETVLPALTEQEQYTLGRKAGETLRRIHSIPAPDDLGNWSVRYNETTRSRIQAFVECGIQIKGSEAILRYFEGNNHLSDGRTQCLLHGDYHRGNFMVVYNNDLSVLDWESFGYGDPWSEFGCINNDDVIPHFNTGMIHGYFNGEPPCGFWPVLALYLSAGALMLVSWAFYRQKDCLEYCISNANNLLHWYNKMNNPVPAWYLKDYHV